METMFHILGRFARSSAGGLHGRGTISIPMRRVLGVTCSIPPMSLFVVGEQALSPLPHPSQPDTPIWVCAWPSAGVGRMYVSIPFADTAPITPHWQSA